MEVKTVATMAALMVDQSVAEKVVESAVMMVV